MRSKTIFTAAILSLAAGVAYAQAENGPPTELKDAQHPPIHSEELASPQAPDAQAPAAEAPASPVIQSEEPGSVQTPSASADASATLMTEEQAKAKLESEGYTEISGLMKDAMGMWKASAMKEGKSVQLSLDTEGHIAVIN